MKIQRVAIVTSIHPDFDSRIWKHAQILSEAGVGVELICPWDVQKGARVGNICFHPFRKADSRLKRLYQIPLRILPLVLEVRKKVDLIHFHDIDLLPWMVCFSFGMPMVYDVHENYPEEMLVRDWIPRYLRNFLSFSVRWGQFFLSYLIKNIVLVAPSQEHNFSNSRFHKMFLYNFASCKLLEKAANDYAAREDIVVFIGSQHVNNGSLLLLDIAERTCKRLPQVKFWITDRFSSDTFRLSVIDQIAKRKLTGKVILVPNVKPHKLMGVLNKATIGISPNLRVAQQINGIHTKLFEYMAAGVPMVVSDLPHQVGVVEGAQCGFLAQPEDPDSFVDAIEALVTDRRLAAEFGRRGQKVFLEAYSYESQKAKLLRFYQEIVQG